MNKEISDLNTVQKQTHICMVSDCVTEIQWGKDGLFSKSCRVRQTSIWKKLESSPLPHTADKNYCESD